MGALSQYYHFCQPLLSRSSQEFLVCLRALPPTAAKPTNTPEAASLPIVSIGIARPMAIQNIESFLLLIICLHRHNGSTRLKLLPIIAPVLKSFQGLLRNWFCR